MIKESIQRSEVLKTLLLWGGRLGNAQLRELLGVKVTRASQIMSEFHSEHPSWMNWDTVSRSYRANPVAYRSKFDAPTEAKRSADQPKLLIYTAGMPSPAWRAMYRQILSGIAPGTPIYHWGDVDEGGFRIAATLAKVSTATGHAIRPYSMSPDDVPLDRRQPANRKTLNRMKHFADSAGWDALGTALLDAGFTVEQEAL